MDWSILIPLIVGLICALFGYLLGRLFAKGEDHSADIELWQNKNDELETALAKCMSQLADAKSSDSGGAGNGVISSFADANVVAVPFDGDAARAVFGKPINQDDLTLVEGIGPKIRELFHDHGVSTWQILSETSVQRCQDILNTGGERYSVHNPGTWPRQAGMAYQGKWQELLDWQDILDHGKE